MPSSKPPSADPDDKLDPMFVHAWRELKVSLLAFVLFGAWVIGVSWLLGRPPDTASAGITLGIPSWAFWGVVIPWLAANVFIFWFCFGFMADDPLQSTDEELDESASTPTPR